MENEYAEACPETVLYTHGRYLNLQQEKDRANDNNYKTMFPSAGNLFPSKPPNLREQ